jgi:Ca-activated chloride channel family protein
MPVLLGAALVAIASASLRAGDDPPAGPRFRTSADTVALNVTVSTRDGHVPSLQPDDFVVYDNGAPQHVTVFGQADVPVDVMLLVDSSASIDHRVDLLRAAAKELFRSLRPADRGAVLAFNRGLRELAGWNSDRLALERAIDAMAPRGSTSLHTAVYVALDRMNASVVSHGEIGWRRRAIVVLSDGADTSSRLSFDDTLEACRRSSTLLYTVRVKEPSAFKFPLFGRKAPSPDPGYVLKTLARETGAAAFEVEEQKELPVVLSQIGAALRQQYLLGYVAPPSNSRESVFRLVSVAVPRVPDAVARTRVGYYTVPSRQDRTRPPS